MDFYRVCRVEEPDSRGKRLFDGRNAPNGQEDSFAAGTRKTDAPAQR